MFWVAMNFAWKWKGVNFWKGKKSSFSHIAEFFLLAQMKAQQRMQVNTERFQDSPTSVHY